MIAPAEIKAKALRLLPKAIDAWLAGESESMFPWPIPSDLRLSKVHSENIRDVELLRQASKEMLGYGYSVRWESRNSRVHGRNDSFPKSIIIDSMDDLLKLTGSSAMFRRLDKHVTYIRERLPALDTWIRKSWKQLEGLDEQTVGGLVLAAEYIKEHPRPDCFIRELPIPVPTKLIKNHSGLFAAWLDMLLPDDAIDCSCHPRNFEQRYGFRWVEPHVLMRVLDSDLQAEVCRLSAELSLPLRSLKSMALSNVRVVFVENQVNLLTFPQLDRTLAFFGMGKNITHFFQCDWLRTVPILYWGDLDVEGFEILAMLRRQFPQVRSMLMDLETIHSFEQLATPGNGHAPNTPAELTEPESAAFNYLKTNNLRIEQEHLLQSFVERWLHSNANVFSAPAIPFLF
jgi:hypothetical protein